ncbi:MULTISPECIES: MBL fold metallo-hydrolase [unclassified Embleya]|uniref:MBL fold metallo-hydrolase n=1 Tax=unclassified Embleya TaxID=2699296 RepID=UPI0033EDCBC8
MATMNTQPLPGNPRESIGGPASPRVTCLLAPNPSAMSLDGTNTWIVAEPGADTAVVIDPGPDDEGHLRAIVAAVEADGRRVSRILLTHGHLDHSAGVAGLKALTNAVVHSVDPQWRYGGEGLVDGQVIDDGGLDLRVLVTPGHSGDSVCFLVAEDRFVVTGDTVLGRGTTVVAHPDGRLGDYLDSLRRLRALAESGEITAVLPAHGPILDDAAGVLDFYLSHRADRLAQVRAAVAAGDKTAQDVVERVYAHVDRGLWWAAEMSVRAQLEYLAEHADA